MVRCKNDGGAPSDGDESPPKRIEVARGKRVKIAAKKRKRTLTEVEVAQAVSDAETGLGHSYSICPDSGSSGRVLEAAARVPETVVRDAEAAGSHPAAVPRAPTPPCHCWGTSTTVCPDSRTIVQWTSESGTAEFSVYLSPAAGASNVSVFELHSYSDGVYSTSSAETSPPLRHSVP
jgi:hypothetical protein